MRAQLIPKHPNPRLHDARDPRAYVGGLAPDSPSESDWELLFELFTSIRIEPNAKPDLNTPLP